MVISPQQDKTWKTLDGTDCAVSENLSQESPQETSTEREAIGKTNDKGNDIEGKKEAETASDPKTMTKEITQDASPLPQDEDPKSDIRKDAEQTSGVREKQVCVCVCVVCVCA